MNIEQPILHKKTFQELTTDELYELLRIRSEVFVVEQNCVYQDMDNDDQKSLYCSESTEFISFRSVMFY